MEKYDLKFKKSQNGIGEMEILTEINDGDVLLVLELVWSEFFIEVTNYLHFFFV